MLLAMAVVAPAMASCSCGSENEKDINDAVLAGVLKNYKVQKRVE